MNTHDIDVLILAGGRGRRLREVVSDKPKPMAEINGQPFLEILIDHISHFGYRRFILCTGHMSEFIINFYKNKKTIYKVLLSNELKSLGTAGAVKNAESLVHSNPFMVFNGDSFCQVDLSEFLDFHLKRTAFMSMVVADEKNTEDYGTIHMDDSYRILSFQEKRAANRGGIVSAGIYLFDKSVFELIPPQIEYSLEYDVFPNITNQSCYCFRSDNKLIDIGTPKNYEKAGHYFANFLNSNSLYYIDSK